MNLDHVLAARVSSSRAVDEATAPVVARLGLASAVRHLAEEVDVVAVSRCDGWRMTGEVARVGADFLELVDVDREADRTSLLPFAALVTVAPA